MSACGERLGECRFRGVARVDHVHRIVSLGCDVRLAAVTEDRDPQGEIRSAFVTVGESVSPEFLLRRRIVNRDAGGELVWIVLAGGVVGDIEPPAIVQRQTCGEILMLRSDRPFQRERSTGIHRENCNGIVSALRRVESRPVFCHG